MALLISWGNCSLIIINVYLSPSSKNIEIENKWQRLETFVRSLILEYPRTMVLLVGDLNARIGPDDSSLANKYRGKIGFTEVPGLEAKAIKGSTLQLSWCLPF